MGEGGGPACVRMLGERLEKAGDMEGLREHLAEESQ